MTSRLVSSRKEVPEESPLTLSHVCLIYVPQFPAWIDNLYLQQGGEAAVDSRGCTLSAVWLLLCRQR